ncbi:MAG: SpoIIE family protein phosphatase [Solobacterium sp.]|nr:SpoIIE family protein phosphatase [Solobacterium sp.]
MLTELNTMFSQMIGTIAVILLVSAFVGTSDHVSRLREGDDPWKYALFAGVLGGVFGIYGNISGIAMDGAILSVRDTGPMLAGFIGGPYGGLLAGLICGIHRLTMGGITAGACVVATCSIGLMCGLIAQKFPDYVFKPYRALLISTCMEAFHLLVVLVMVKPFSTAYGIVTRIAIPFIVVNSLGFMLMMTIIRYTRAQRNISRERNRLQSELEVARVIQYSLLPQITDTYPGRKELDISGYMEPAKEVGGDFYDMFFVDSDHLALLIGDVSGKGVPAALFMANAKITLQNVIRDLHKLSPALVVANNALCARNEAEMFITLWVGILDLNTYELTYASAGHNPPVIVQGGKAEYLRTKNSFVLAGMKGMVYKENTLTLNHGDVLYLYTDGVTEADTAEHELYGEERLLKCFENTGEMSAEQIIQTVKASVDEFVSGNDQFDDMTMLCIKLL